MKIPLRRWLLGLSLLFVLVGFYEPQQADAQIVVQVGPGGPGGPGGPPPPPPPPLPPPPPPPHHHHHHHHHDYRQ